MIRYSTSGLIDLAALRKIAALYHAEVKEINGLASAWCGERFLVAELDGAA